MENKAEQTYWKTNKNLIVNGVLSFE